MTKLKTKRPNPIDVHVGSRLRMRRLMLNPSQEKLGKALGITFQQVQKYEKGVNRMGSSRLQQAGRPCSLAVIPQRVRLQRRWIEANQSGR